MRENRPASGMEEDELMRTLREQLHFIGDALAGAEAPEPAGVPESTEAPERATGTRQADAPGPVRHRRRGALWALAASAAVVASLTGLGLFRLAAQPADESEAKLTDEGVVACARVIAEGTVARTEPAGDRTRVVLTADRFLKPDRDPGEVEFDIPRDEAGAFRPGTHSLVIISRFPDEPVEQFTGEQVATTWEWMTAALPASRALDCDTPG
ncbi:hypothetical protein [Streptomyces sp. NPDC051662]|uniref:hypothetical protein n=1 Tax=Streptomyces sp. NPDC051662 TaxID=3154750 RepID=UPI003441A95D